MPASGASTRRFGSTWEASFQLSVSLGTESSLAPVEIPDQPQAGEGEEVVDLVDRVAERRYGGRKPAGGDCGQLLAHVLSQPADDPIDLAGEAVDDPGPDRGDRRSPDELAGRLNLHRR